MKEDPIKPEDMRGADALRHGLPSLECAEGRNGTNGEYGGREPKDTPGSSVEKRRGGGEPAALRIGSRGDFAPNYAGGGGIVTMVMEREFPGAGDRKLFDLPVDREVLFSDHNGRHRKGLEKRRSKLVERLAFLKPFLEEDERILLVTTGCSPMSVLEQAVTGWIVYALKRSLIVFTNRRIFHIPTKANFSYRHSIAHIRYPDCREIALKRGCLHVRYQDDSKETFSYIDRRERKTIKTLLAGISPEGARSAAGRRTHLCPRCTAELVRDRFTCPNCRLVFKNLSDGRRNSILYPGGGYFYTRHPFLGAGDAITELILTVLLIASLIDMLRGGGSGYLLPAIWGVALIAEKAISVYHSNHFIQEYIPVTAPSSGNSPPCDR